MLADRIKVYGCTLLGLLLGLALLFSLIIIPAGLGDKGNVSGLRGIAIGLSVFWGFVIVVRLVMAVRTAILNRKTEQTRSFRPSGTPSVTMLASEFDDLFTQYTLEAAHNQFTTGQTVNPEELAKHVVNRAGAVLATKYGLTEQEVARAVEKRGLSKPNEMMGQRQAALGRVRCSKCGTSFDVSIVLGATGEVRVAQCRVCPVNKVFAICERCADLDQVQEGPCPWCKADNMWEISSMVSA
jgi:hypothetical protein